MHEMSDGMQIDPEVHVQVLQNKLAQMAVREAQMEAGIQQLIQEVARLDAMVPKDTEVKEDASADK
jgi:hypothetical protein